MIPEGYVSLSELSQKWKLSRNVLFPYVRSCSSVIKIKNSLYISFEDVEEYEKKHLQKRKPILEEPYLSGEVLKSWLIEHGCTTRSVKNNYQKIINAGLISGGILISKSYMFPERELLRFFEDYEVVTIYTMDNQLTNNRSIKPKNHLSIREVSMRLGIHFGSVYKIIDKGKLKKPVEVLGYNYIPIDEIIRYENEKEEATIEVTVPWLLNRLITEIDRISAGRTSEENMKLYITYCSTKLKSSTASIKKKRNNINEYILAFERCISKITKQGYRISDKELERIVLGDITNRQKEIVSDFIKYCDSLNNITRTTNYSVNRLSSKTNSDEDAIYTPEIYLAYIDEIMQIERLTPLAIRVQSIANTWLYIIMHLTDLWRSSSIIDDLPVIDIEEIDINSFSWFHNNALSINQAQTIVNQVQLKIKNSIASKNKAVLYFHVIPDLAVPFATAAVLCELHRRQKEQKLLLHTLRSGFVKSVRDKFFFNHELSKCFQSIKMNRSTSTYLFYSVLEEDGPDSDIALELTSMLRSHKKQTTTEIYLNNTNKDGSINRVSINVFRRGHFGWLFNYIVSMASETVPTSHRLEQKTLQIEELRSKLKPYEIEAWGKFITAIKERDRSVIAELSTMPQEYFKQLIKKILLGKMPSRQENGQCLVYPKCSFTNKLQCMDCKYFIPQSYMLIEAVEELKRISLTLENSKYDAIRERDSKLFLYIFILFNEAYQALGKDYVDSFLSKEEFTRIVKKTSEFLKLPVQ